ERQCRAQPEKVLADSGFYSGQNLQARGMGGYIPDSNLARELNTGKAAGGKPRVRHRETRRMRQKLRRPAGRKIYQQRKAIVEPVIGNAERTTRDAAVPASRAGGGGRGTGARRPELQLNPLLP